MISDTTYYDLTRLRDASPETQDWSVTDGNFETLSLLLKSFEQHHHTGLSPLNYPGYYAPLSAPGLTTSGVIGTTSYAYYVVARGLTPAQVTPVATMSIGNGTLNNFNYNVIQWTAVPGATSYDVIRIVGGATQGVIASGISTTIFSDTGVVATAYTAPTQPALTEVNSGGSLAPGSSIGVRLSYVNSLGLETQACPERIITLSPTASRPLSPQLVSITGVGTGAVPGGTYVYVLTKRKGSGETVVSDILTVNVPFDQTYDVTLRFDPISSYTDGTDSLQLYRAVGLASSFTLITTITSPAFNTFTDANAILSENAGVQPPNNSTFDSAKCVTVDWSGLGPLPSDAAKIRVYVTQQTGIWPTNSLLQEVDLSTIPPASVTYLGSETLASGWPKNSTEIPASPPPINLGTEATGAPVLTADMNFQGHKANNMVLGSPPISPLDGSLWYDSSTGKVRVQESGVVIDLSQPTVFVNYVPNPSLENGLTTPYTAGAGVTLSVVSGGAPGPAFSTQALGASVIGTGANMSVNAGLSDIVSGVPQSDHTYFPVAPGEFLNIQGAIKLTAGTTGVSTSLSVSIAYVDATGSTVATPSGQTFTQVNPVIGTWYYLGGNITVPTSAAYATIVITSVAPTSAGTSSIVLDEIAAISIPTLATTAGYFDGDQPTCYWKGTASASSSVKGGFQHANLEVGGHLTSHIIHGSTDLATILRGYGVTSTGGQSPGTLVGKASVFASGPSISSPTPAQIPDMAVTLTTAFTNQWIEAKFSADLGFLATGVFLGQYAQVAIYLNGSLQAETVRTITVENFSYTKYIPFELSYTYQSSVVTTYAFAVYWWTDSTNTEVLNTGLRRSFVVKGLL